MGVKTGRSSGGEAFRPCVDDGQYSRLIEENGLPERGYSHSLHPVLATGQKPAARVEHHAVVLDPEEPRPRDPSCRAGEQIATMTYVATSTDLAIAVKLVWWTYACPQRIDMLADNADDQARRGRPYGGRIPCRRLNSVQPLPDRLYERDWFHSLLGSRSRVNLSNEPWLLGMSDQRRHFNSSLFDSPASGAHFRRQHDDTSEEENSDCDSRRSSYFRMLGRRRCDCHRRC
jgi:hypothetical protein